MNELSISKQYPAENFNLLGNTDIIVKVPDIKTPVIQSVKLDTNPQKGDVYIQQKAKDAYTDRQGNYHPASPALYAVTKNGLKNWQMGPGLKCFPVSMLFLRPARNVSLSTRTVERSFNVEIVGTRMLRIV